MIPTPIQPLVTELLGRSTFAAPGTSVACAVSGGADSMALMVLAVAAGCHVTAHHVDHGLRTNSELEAATVQTAAARFGADFVGHRAEVPVGSNLEARARAARYNVLPAKITTGHTLDDRAETILINLMRGAARTGLSPLSDQERHPIIKIRRHETHALCEALEIDVVVDPSNDDPAFVRNRVRHELLPLMDQIGSRDLAPVLDRQAEILGAEDEFLDIVAREIDATDARAVAAAHPVLARRALRHLIMQSWSRGHPPSFASVDRVLEVARGAAVSCEIEGGHRVHRTGQRLRVEPPSIV